MRLFLIDVAVFVQQFYDVGASALEIGFRGRIDRGFGVVSVILLVVERWCAGIGGAVGYSGCGFGDDGRCDTGSLARWST